jgi:hypothetical protein
MLSIKDGVTLLGLQPQMIVAVISLHAIYQKRGVELVITAGNDGKHSETSEHYGGRALDFRTNNLPVPQADGNAIARELGAMLGRDYHVLFEGDHLHVAFKPKRAKEIT